ncbi:MAG: hypothetical protein IMF02_14945 [Proteobacteria bacterium]|nr:hypothetical protein [Pseudomonadota bacterium]
MPGGKSISVSSQLFVVRGLLIVGFISMLMVSAGGELYLFIISRIIPVVINIFRLLDFLKGKKMVRNSLKLL